MTGYQAHGFDIVIEVAESIVGLTAEAELPGLLEGHSGDLADYDFAGVFNFGAAVGEGAARERATVSLEAPGTDTATLEIPFLFTAELDPSAGMPTSTPELSGRVQIVATVGVHQETATTVYPAFDFRGLDRAQVRVVEHDPLSEPWQPYGAELVDLVERIVLDRFHSVEWHDVALAPISIDPANDGRDPFTPVTVDARVIRDGTTHSIALLLTTTPEAESIGDRDSVTTSALGPTDTAVVIVGNEVLLRRVIGRAFLDGLGLLDPTALVPMAELYGLLDYTDNRVTLAEPLDLRHRIDEWWASRVDLRRLTIQVLADETIDVAAEILAGGPLVHAICNLHMTGRLAAAASGVTIRWHLDTPTAWVDAGPVTWLGLGPLAAILWTLSGLAGDLVFAEFEGPLTSAESGCTLVGRDDWPAEAEPVDIDCPVTVPDIPWAFINDVILDDWAMVGTLDLPDPTIEAVQPNLAIVGDWRVTDGEFGEGHATTPTAGVTGWCFTHFKQHSGDFRAIPTGPVVHPIEYAWCLGGYALSGHGTVALGEASVAYDVDRSRCELTIEAGGSLDTELAVSATDTNGTELLARRTMSVKGREQYCHYEGVEQIEGPPPELSQPGPYLADQAYGPGLPTESATDAVSRGGFDLAVRVALKRGMGVDPADPSVRRPEGG